MLNAAFFIHTKKPRPHDRDEAKTPRYHPSSAQLQIADCRLRISRAAIQNLASNIWQRRCAWRRSCSTSCPG